MNNVEIRRIERELFAERDALLRDVEGTTHPLVVEALQLLLDLNRQLLVDLPQCDIQQDRDLREMEEEHRRSVKRLPPEQQLDVFDAGDVVKRLYRNGDAKQKMRLKALYMLAMGGTPLDRVTEEEIENARQSYLEDILGSAGVKVRNRQCCCVFHQEDTPSMHIYPNNSFYCFGCGEHGDAIKLYRHLHQADFKTTVRALQ